MPTIAMIFCAISVGLGIASYWNSRLVGPAVAALSAAAMLNQ